MYGVANTSDSMVLGSPVSANTSAHHQSQFNASHHQFNTSQFNTSSHQFNTSHQFNASSHQPAQFNAPSSHQAQFLPGYLLGDSSFAGGSSPMTPQRMWGTPGGHSPPKSSARSLVSPQAHSGLLVSPRSENRTAGRDYSHRAKDKSGAPPVMGLFDHIASPIPAQSPLPPYQRSQNLDGSYAAPAVTVLDHEQSQQLRTTSGGRLYVPTSGLFSPHGEMTSPGRQTPPSPPQLDPFYTQGESIRPDDRLDETWVTVFGFGFWIHPRLIHQLLEINAWMTVTAVSFTAAASSFILQQFSQYGNIVQHVVSPEGNWMHLHYQSKIQAKKALSKNGKIFGNGIMVGVQPCIDKKLMNQHRDSNVSNLSMTSQHSTMTSLSTTPSVQQIGAQESRRALTPGGNMRPLTSAYRAASAEHDVLNKTHTPQKSTSMIGKALEYVFGW